VPARLHALSLESNTRHQRDAHSLHSPIQARGRPCYERSIYARYDRWRCRQRRAPMPARPRPSSVRDAGSGTGAGPSAMYPEIWKRAASSFQVPTGRGMTRSQEPCRSQQPCPRFQGAARSLDQTGHSGRLEPSSRTRTAHQSPIPTLNLPVRPTAAGIRRASIRSQKGRARR
jgi:hypothetical protein